MFQIVNHPLLIVIKFYYQNAAARILHTECGDQSLVPWPLYHCLYCSSLAREYGDSALKEITIVWLILTKIVNSIITSIACNGLSYQYLI